jgi:hypothetical protein
MASYWVGFRSGERIEVTVDDAEDFVKTVAAALQGDPKATSVWLNEPGRLLQVTQIAYVVKR